MTFTMPVWISPPAKVYQQRIIEQITNRINDYPDDWDPDAYDFFGGQTFLTRDIFTPLNASINVVNGQIQLLNHAGLNDRGDGQEMNWADYLETYGGLKDGVTQIRLRLQSDPEAQTNPDDIVGTIEETGTGNVVDYTVDTDTLPGTAFTVNAIINPHNSYPDDGTLPVAATGQKYLILDDIGAIGASNVTNAWDNLVANKNDIIQYNGSSWVVFFDSSATEDITYIQNNFTGDQFKWNGTQWMDSYQGKYYPGFWRIVM